MPKLAVIGAGRAGLTFASLLRAADKGYEIVIFEKEASAEAGADRGGTLDLHADTGLAAIRAAGLEGAFDKYARYEGQDMVFSDKHGAPVFESGSDESSADRTSPDARPEIDRKRLREVLLESVPKHWVRRGSRLQSMSESDFLQFDHGTEGPFDLIIGADGASSKVRTVLTDIQPSYSGICGFGLHVKNPADDFLEVSKMIGRGCHFAYGDRKALQGFRQGDGGIQIYAWASEAEDYPTKLWNDVGQAAQRLKDTLIETVYQGWAPDLLA